MTLPFYKQEKPYTCGSAAMRMVLAAIGIKKSENCLSRLLNATPEEGCASFEPFSKVARKFKLDYVEKKKGTIKELKELMVQNYSIIVCYMDLKNRKEEEAHYSVVKKIDKKNIYLYDPYYGPKIKFGLAHFRKIWSDRMHHSERGWFIAIKK